MSERESKKQSQNAMNSWSKFFSILGGILIFVAILDLLIGIGNENFIVEGYYFDKFSGELFWMYVVSTTSPMIGSGIMLLFLASVIEFAIDFYTKLCMIQIKLDTSIGQPQNSALDVTTDELPML